MPEMEQVERVYSHYAGFYDILFDRVLDPGRKQAVELLGLKEGDRVLEIGIGTGLSLQYFPSCGSITGIDISNAMLEETEEKVSQLGLRNVELYRMDASRLDFPDDRFDKILIPYVLSTVPHPRRVMDEAIRVAKPGARIAILNHFGSRFRLFRGVEKILTPLTRRIGFRLDCPISTVSCRGDLQIERERRVNLLGLWRLLLCRIRQGSK